MTVIRNKRGTWINQFSQPNVNVFTSRVRQVDYVVIKYGLAQYEQWARDAGVPWLAERMGEPNGPAAAVMYANQLADQALQPGCIGAVINLEEADGGWHLDDGTATRLLIETFRSRCPGIPLFASLDTRSLRPNSPYQLVCAELCDGVMPMVYPGAFGLASQNAFNASLTPAMLARWAGKEVHPTYQTYSPPPVSVSAEVWVVAVLYNQHVIHGANTYTLGHATDEQWEASLGFRPLPPATADPDPAIVAALVALHAAWVKQWTAIADHGSVSEAVALADYWRRLIGQN